MAETFEISVFANLHDTRPERVSFSWAELSAAMSDHERREKKDGPLWSPALYREGGSRKNADVVSFAPILVYDIDDATDDQMAEVLGRAEALGVDCFFYSSWSHIEGSGQNRFRLVVRLSRAVTREEWAPLWTKAAAYLRATIDEKCGDLCRFYFTPSAPPDSGDVVFHAAGSVPLDVDAVLALAAPEKKGASASKLKSKRETEKSKTPKEFLAAFAGIADAKPALGRDDKQPEGGRNDALFKACCGIRRKIPKISEGALRAFAGELNREKFDPPLDDVELDNIVTSAFRYEMPYSLTQDGNAERLWDKHGEDFFWVATWKRWVAWSGTAWQKDTAREALTLAAREVVIVDLAEEHAAVAIEAGRDEHAAKRAALLSAHIQRSSTSAMYEGMMKIAAARLAATHTEFDNRPWLFACANGTLDLKTGERREHRREDLLMASSPVAFNPNAPQDVWRRFVDDVTGGDAALARYLQKAVGYSLTGDVSEHALFFLYGSGANGKSLFINTVLAALGQYGHTAPAKLLTTKKGEAHPTEQAGLYGARFVSCPEIEGGAGWDEEKLKMLTGGDKITARRMNEDFWEFVPTHKFWISGNHLPSVRETKNGIWRRMRVIPFEQSFVGREDHKLPERLLANLEGVLAWAVEGCALWIAEGLHDVPSAISKATEEYREEEDTIGQYLAERCEIGSFETVTLSDLYADYKRWGVARGDDRWAFSYKAFNKKIREHGVEQRLVGKDNTRSWFGIELKNGPAGRFADLAN